MRLMVRLLLSLGAVLGGAAAQQSATPPRQVGCGIHGDIEVFCGVRQPEDLERTPDGKFLIATQYLNQGRGGASGGGMILFDLGKKIFSRMSETIQADKSWG